MNQAVFNCTHCGYSQAVDPVYIGTVFSCPTCSAVVMVTAVGAPDSGQAPPPPQQTAPQESPAADHQPQQAAYQVQQTAPQAQQQAAQAQQQTAQTQQQSAQEASRQAQQHSEQIAQQAQLAAQQAQQQAQQHAEQYIQQTAYAAQQAGQAGAAQAQATANGYAQQANDAATAYAQDYAYAEQANPAQEQAAYIEQGGQALQPQNAAPPQQPGFDPAMVAYQTGAVNSPVGVPVAPSGPVGDTYNQPFENAMEHPLNVPVPDSRRSGSVFGNVLLFAILYILFMTPYLLPYLKSFGLTDLSLLESGSVMSPFTLKLVCSACLIIIALFRGIAIGKAWLFAFPVVAGVVSFMPNLGLPLFIPPAFHALTLALGVLLSPRRTRKLTF